MPMWCISTVYPSGLARATSPAATVPPAPSTFWTTIWAPSFFDIGSAISRVTVSVGPPAENGTTTVMFRSGYPSAPPPPEVPPPEPPPHAVTNSERAPRRTSGLTAPSSLVYRIQSTSLSAPRQHQAYLPVPEPRQPATAEADAACR